LSVPMSAPLKTCAFCGLAKKMTSEHVWGEWTKGYVERTAKNRGSSRTSPRAFARRAQRPSGTNVFG